MKKSAKKIAIALGAIMLLQPVMYADAKLNKEIVALELEITKMKTRMGEYASMSDEQVEKKLAKAQKELEKKKAKAKKELDEDTKEFREDLKQTGKDLKKTGKSAGKAVKSIFD